LGVRSDADLPEIKAAFRRLAREFHPDRNKSPGAEEKFNELTEAYSTIVSSYGLPITADTGAHRGSNSEEFKGKLDFTIFTDKEVVHSVSPKLFEEEIRKRFNPSLDPGISCKVDKTWFEIGVETSGKMPIFGSRMGKRKSLIEWYKGPDGTDRWKSTTWDAFWEYVRTYAAQAIL
jgi:hypothetical protein